LASWVLVPSLTSLSAELDVIAPNRDKGSDGSIGDDAHSQRSSDHNPDETGATPDEDSDSKNEVHAMDRDKDLKLSGVTMQDVVDHLVGECRKSGTSGKDRGRLKYIIFNGYIWDAPGWEKVKYTGSNPHDQHAHFSAEYDSQYSEDTSPWGLIDKFGDIVTPEDRKAIASEVWAYLIKDANAPDDKPRSLSAATWLGWSDARHVTTREVIIDELTEQTARLQSGVTLLDQRFGENLRAIVTAIGEVDGDLDEATLAAGIASSVLAGLSPEVAAQVADEIGERLRRQDETGTEGVTA
jgi:hypothetical protein